LREFQIGEIDLKSEVTLQNWSIIRFYTLKGLPTRAITAELEFAVQNRCTCFARSKEVTQTLCRKETFALSRSKVWEHRRS
jgi:hypothetical protein